MALHEGALVAIQDTVLMEEEKIDNILLITMWSSIKHLALLQFVFVVMVVGKTSFVEGSSLLHASPYTDPATAWVDSPNVFSLLHSSRAGRSYRTLVQLA